MGSWGPLLKVQRMVWRRSIRQQAGTHWQENDHVDYERQDHHQLHHKHSKNSFGERQRSMARGPRVSNQLRRCPRVLCIVWLGVPRLTWHSVNTDYFIVLRFTCVTASTTAPIAVPNASPRARCPNTAPSATPTAAPTPTPAQEGRFRTLPFTLDPSLITAASEKGLILIQRPND